MEHNHCMIKRDNIDLVFICQNLSCYQFRHLAVELVLGVGEIGHLAACHLAACYYIEGRVITRTEQLIRWN